MELTSMYELEHMHLVEQWRKELKKHRAEFNKISKKIRSRSFQDYSKTHQRNLKKKYFKLVQALDRICNELVELTCN